MLRQSIGFFLQAVVLMLFPTMITWQLLFGMPLVVMPVLTIVGIVLFTTGHYLRRS